MIVIKSMRGKVWEKEKERLKKELMMGTIIESIDIHLDPLAGDYKSFLYNHYVNIMMIDYFEIILSSCNRRDKAQG